MTWRERIAAATARGHFTHEDKACAQSWTTCAVGEQHDAHPSVVVRWPVSFAPFDLTLSILGSAESDGFAWAVRKDRIDEAEAILDEIEDRVLQLKRELPA